MRLHLDSETLGLSTFEFQIRRRLFRQLLSLDDYAGQSFGDSTSIIPNTWYTKQPINNSDGQIFAGVKHQVKAQSRATEMMICLTKTEFSKLYAQAGVKSGDIGTTGCTVDGKDLGKLIDHCHRQQIPQILQNGQAFTLLDLRNAELSASSVRLRCQIPRFLYRAFSDEEKRETCLLAQRLSNNNNATCSHSMTQRFDRHIGHPSTVMPCMCPAQPGKDRILLTCRARHQVSQVSAPLFKLRENPQRQQGSSYRNRQYKIESSGGRPAKRVQARARLHRHVAVSTFT